MLDESPVAPNGDGIVSATGDFAVNFAPPTDFGTDGPGSTSYSLLLTGTNVASGLFALDAADTSAVDGDGIGQGAQIVLNQSGNTITGSVGATTYFTIQIDPATGVVTFTDNTANNLWHSNTGNPDDPQTLTLSDPSLLQLVQTVTDADGDSDTAALNLGSGVFTVQDDGPDAVVVNPTAAAIVLDESPVAPNGDGIVSATGNFALNFAAAADGLRHRRCWQRDAMRWCSPARMWRLGCLRWIRRTRPRVTATALARARRSCSTSPATPSPARSAATTYFTIQINPATGVVTFTDNTANDLCTPTPAAPTIPQTLTLSDPSLLQLVQTVTDADGDSDTAAINLGSGVFPIEDDGPDAVVVNPTAAAIVLDESPVGRATATALWSATGNFAG